MKNSMIAALFSCALVSGVAVADTSDNVSVSVNLVKLKKGSLPTSITTYGRVMPIEKARRVIAAPIAAHVSDVAVRTGEQVDKGTPLVTLVPSPESKAAYSQAKLALKTANKLLARSRALFKAHLETAAQLATDQKTAADARSNLDALEQEGAGGPNVLKAPFKALVMRVNASPGKFVPQGAAVLELARPESLMFRTGVVPGEASRIKVGDKVAITPFSGSGVYSGKIVLRGSIVDTANGLVPVDVSIPDKSLLTGEMAKAVINTGVVDGYIVPHDAVLLDESGQTYIVQAVDMAARKVPVTVVGSKGNKDVVTGKVIASAPVVGAGNYQLDNGTRIRVPGSDDHSSGKAGQ